MPRFKQWAVIAAMAALGAAAQAAPRDNLDVRVSVPNPVLRGDVDVTVTVTVTNTARHPVNLLKWQLPSDELEGALFKITRDDQPVAYLGPLVKRTAPQAADKVKLEAGASLSYEVELTGAYDLSQSGRYAIEYVSRGKHDDAATLASAPVYVWLEGRSMSKPVTPPPSGSGISYTGNCSASQQGLLVQAVNAATSYATTATTYLSGTPSATPRYTTWFGAYSSAGWNTAKSHFVAVQSAFTTQALVLDCKCKKPSVYAYVYPTQPYKIYVCGAFWNAPMTGTDSKGGTLIHEMSHFNVVAGTDDWAYGQTAAKALAISDPAKALDNADSHEYFAENTPAQP
ncbi:MAG: M35 family metallo-endopeptidase [Pseudomonadota bacterium]